MSIITGSCSEGLASELFKQGLAERIQQNMIEREAAALQQNTPAREVSSTSPSESKPESNLDNSNLGNRETLNLAEGFKGGLIDTHA